MKAALEYQCDTCLENHENRQSPRPAWIHEPKEFNELVSTDGFWWKSRAGRSYHIGHFLDEGTMFHLGRVTGQTTEQHLENFRETWTSWAGPPQTLLYDAERGLVSDKWESQLQQENINTRLSAVESPWQKGRIERHGEVVEQMIDRIDAEEGLKTDDEVHRAVLQAFKTKKQLSRWRGYAPEQAVLGKATKLPASLTGDEDMGAHVKAEEEGEEGEMFRRTLRMREEARKAFHEADNSSKVRRALLKRSRPVRGPWHKGQWCLIWRKKVNGAHRGQGYWHGPGQVFSTEGDNIVWVSARGKLYRCSAECLRPASLREWQQAIGNHCVSRYPPE